MQSINTLPIVTTDHLSSLNLSQITEHYELLITDGDTSNYNYWYLGLAYLLQEQEADAQATWFIPFEEASELESVSLNSELSDILDRSAIQELAANNLDNSWLISQYLREVDPTHLNNLFRSILLEIKLERFTVDILSEWNATELVSTASMVTVDRELLTELLCALLIFLSEDTCNFTKACLLHHLSNSTETIDIFANNIRNMAHRLSANSLMIELLEFCRTLQPRNFNIANILCRIYSDVGSHDLAIEVSRSIYNFCDNILDKIQTRQK